MNEVFWTCIGKGGKYKILNACYPAGTAKEYGNVVTYIDVESYDVYWRLWEDFYERMAIWDEGQEK